MFLTFTLKSSRDDRSKNRKIASSTPSAAYKFLGGEPKLDPRSLPPSKDESQSKRILKNKHVGYEWQGLESKHIDFRQKVFTFATTRGEKLTIKKKESIFVNPATFFVAAHLINTNFFAKFL